MSVEITRAQVADLPEALEDLAEILHQSVHGGASVGFILPFPRDAAAHFWTSKVFPTVSDGRTILYFAKSGGRILGTVQLGIALPPNQPHRADVAKLLVHPEARRQGLARALLHALEEEARQLGKTLLVLDTRTGDPSQTLYTQMGFSVAGEIPMFCRNPFEDRLESTTYMYKMLE